MMITPANRPLVFLDVDGPLIPFRARPAPRRPPSGDLAGPGHRESGNPLVDRLDPADGRSLLGLGGQLVWATTWMTDANDVISPQLGLPALPVVEFPDTDDEPARGLHWKTTFLTDGQPGAPSYGSTTRRPTSTGNGWRLTIRRGLWSTASTRSPALPTQTSPRSIDGSQTNDRGSLPCPWMKARPGVKRQPWWR